MKHNYEPFWNEALRQISEDLSDQEFATWFRRVRYCRSQVDHIELSVPSQFVKDQLLQRYISIIYDKLAAVAGTNIRIDFKVENSVKTDVPKSEKIIEKQKKKDVHKQLNTKYTFDNFVIGDNNSLAANAAQLIADNPGKIYNPCLIYGGIGLGKTHLIQSIGNHVHNAFGYIKLVYVTMETFTNNYINSLREKKMKDFHAYYRTADVLLLDDIHFIQGKPETQEALFHVFNSMYDRQKQIVLTCDRALSEISDIADRLRSRLKQNLIVDLQPPSYETRCAILNKKIATMSISIPQDVVDFIGSNIRTNVRDLESALATLSAYCDIVDKNITLDIAKQQLKNHVSQYRTENISMHIVQEVVSKYFNVSINDLRGKKRSQQYSLPRQVAMYIIRKVTQYSTTEIGIEFGGRDHTTVMHAYDRIEKKSVTDPTMPNTIKKLIDNVYELNANKK